MASTTLLVGSLLTMLEGVIYAFVAYRLSGRGVQTPQPLAIRLFIVWWYTIGLNKFLAGTAGFAAAYDSISVDSYVALIYFNVLVLCVSLFCLLAYLLYAVTGNVRAMLPIGLLYLGYYFLLTYQIVSNEPAGILLGEWRATLGFENSSPPLLAILTLALLVVPQVGAAIAYAFVAPRGLTKTLPSQRVLVSLSIIAWSASILLVAFPGFAENATMQLTSRLVGVGAAATSLLAFVPPLWLRQRWGLAAPANGPEAR